MSLRLLFLLSGTHPRILLPFPSPLLSAPALSVLSFRAIPRASRRKSSPPPPPSPQQHHHSLDPHFRDSINQLSTDAVKAMLSDDMKRMGALLDQIYDLELYFQKEKEVDALRFVLVIRDMLDHRISREAKDLKGSYKKAFDKICSIVEDSGWLLKGDEHELGVQMVDDELIPSTLFSEYN